VHQVKGVQDGFAEGTDGKMERTQFTLPVDKESKEVRLPAAIAGGDSARDGLRREKLRPFIEGLAAHIGDGEISYQNAGNFLGTLPGYRAAVIELRMNNQNLRQILGLFPELQLGPTIRRR